MSEGSSKSSAGSEVEGEEKKGGLDPDQEAADKVPEVFVTPALETLDSGSLMRSVSEGGARLMAAMRSD